MTERRIGFVGIIIENRRQTASKVNAILSEFGERIVARTGVPFEKGHCGVIALIVDVSTDEIGELTGRLGQIPDVHVKSALSRKCGTAAFEKEQA